MVNKGFELSIQKKKSIHNDNRWEFVSIKIDDQIKFNFFNDKFQWHFFFHEQFIYFSSAARFYTIYQTILEKHTNTNVEYVCIKIIEKILIDGLKFEIKTFSLTN